jgi:hypothetical protein
MEELFMRMKPLYFIGLIALALAPLYGQQYWSATPPDCSSLGATFGTPVAVPGGYSCSVTGTFVWLAAGGVAKNPASWGTVIRVAAPASNPVGVDYTFYDVNGNNLSLDTTIDNSSLASGNEVDFALYANQPAEVELLGAAGDGPGYAALETGSVYAQFFCPDATTCLNVLPQLMYSALPTYPWSLSVPIAWDDALSYQWSAEGIDDGGTNVVSLVIYNETSDAATFNVDVYDNTGTLAGTGTTPAIPGFSSATGEAGTSGVVLSQIVPNLPPGIFKILIDGGSSLSAVEVLQVNGSSATTLQVAYDTSPGTASARTGHRSSAKRLHAAPAPTKVFPALKK